MAGVVCLQCNVVCLPHHHTKCGFACVTQVIQPYISVDLSFRTAPGTDEKKASVELKALLEANPPYGAKACLSRFWHACQDWECGCKAICLWPGRVPTHVAYFPHAQVTFTPGETAPNFLAPVPKPWLDFAMDLGAEAFYGRPRLAAGRGGTVPMMSYFSEVCFYVSRRIDSWLVYQYFDMSPTQVYQGLDFDILATGVLVPDTGHHVCRMPPHRMMSCCCIS
jgi:hypothetical protein